MPTDPTKIDQILQFALLLAGEEDDYLGRQLGPIHLVKYVYLSDLSFARDHQGETYTGVPWQFHKFGPWSQTVNARIKPALSALHADERIFESHYEDREDWVRWSKTDEGLLELLRRELPSSIRLELPGLVHRFGKDTPCLLDHVYKTTPMLSASPGELLDFSLEPPVVMRKSEGAPSRMESLTERKQKKLRERLRELKGRGGSPARPKLVKPDAPRYDKIFVEGVSWLDKLAGTMPAEGFQTVEFSDDVWKSETRKGKDVS